MSAMVASSRCSESTRRSDDICASAEAACRRGGAASPEPLDRVRWGSMKPRVYLETSVISYLVGWLICLAGTVSTS
jgi:hypothetical protein